jgi:hypothetical protein
MKHPEHNHRFDTTDRALGAPMSSPHSRMKRLALALSTACIPLAATAAASFPAAHHAPTAPSIWVVQNCSDHDPNSLRDIVQNPAYAQSGDIVDLTHLPTSCGLADSVITLDSEIAIAQDNLSLIGPARGQGSVTISGGGVSRVLNHAGAGTLDISDLRISQGYYQTVGAANGGCILSAGSVALKNARVTGCKTKSTMGRASGGAIAAHYDVGLDHSVVSGNQALAPSSGGYGYGGAIRAGNFHCKYSSISANSMIAGLAGAGAGGA